jgi:hypothetical protein
MLKNISSMNKKDNKELLEIPEFLKNIAKNEKENPEPAVKNTLPESINANEAVEEAVQEPKPTPKPKVDIQAKIKEHTQNYYIDIKDVIDQQIEGEKVGSVYEYCKENNIALTYCSKIIDLVKGYMQEPYIGLQARSIKQDERTEEQQDLYEAYHGFSAKELNGMLTVFTQALTDIEGWGKIKQGERKARKPRAMSVERMIKKLQYKKEDSKYKLVSIDPILIPRCQMLWVFNTKTRKLTQYNAMSRNGITIKGTTLKDFDTKISVSKTVRKPEAVLPKLQTTDGKIAMRNIWESIKTTETKGNGRINVDTILFKVLK